MKRKTIFLVHTLYWSYFIISLLFYTYLTKSYSPGYKSVAWINYSINHVWNLIAFYIAYLILFPKFLPQKRYLNFFLYSTITFIFISGLCYCSYILLKEQYLNSQGLISSKLFRPDHLNLYSYSVNVLVGLINGSLLKGFISWYSESRDKEYLKRKNLQTELALLRAQLNPHFLFNTLNNIDILIEKDPKAASVYLNKLSDIMRFTIYDSSAEKITLGQELEYIQKYIELQRIRTTNADFVRYEFFGNPVGLNIGPMLFIPFIENAFKHATDKKIENAIDVSISVKGTDIHFKCKNKFDTVPALSEQKGGVGIDLIQNRLDLIYPNHKLEIQKSDEQYCVTLSLDLSED